ncbi:MAG: fused MFS/spermidine synthase [Acidobacteriota bacterium]
MPTFRSLFASVVFLAAFLLFFVEPIAAKQLLPLLGGSAAVWITCLVFFQTALLLGYLYAHWLSRRPHWRLNAVLLLLAIVSALAWVVRPFTAAGAAHPFIAIFSALSLSIGLPFLLLAATSPLLQILWARVENTPVPYWLYALSNFASLLALGLYPTLIEPNLTLRVQRLTWCIGFVAFAALSAALTRSIRSTPAASTQPPVWDQAPPASMTRKLLWLLLPMGASMQLSAVTVHLTANIAAVPLLWILPLAVYLLTLIFAFQFPWLLARGILTRMLVVVLASLAYMLVQVDHSWPIWLSIPFFLVALSVACLFCHAQAYALRPQRISETTLFYLLFAAGGALGSFLIGIAAPMVFRFNYDLPITFFITALLALAATWRTHWAQRLLWSAATIAMFAVVIMVGIAYRRNTIVAVRNFYGALRVKQDHYTMPGFTTRTLLNGSIQHGTQIFGTDAMRRTPTTYYAPDSGVGYALRDCCLNPDGAIRPRNIGVIGLGAGTIAAYGTPADHIRFYEINPADIPIARNVFTYIRDSGSHVEIIPGDGRVSLSRESPQHFDVLVVDAFTGDAIPLHLLTREALALYRRHLAPGGIIAFHISNQYVDLESPIARLASAAGMQARHVNSLSNDARGEFVSNWILVTDNAAFFLQPDLVAHAFYPDKNPRLRLWTDDYSALLPFVRW